MVCYASRMWKLGSSPIIAIRGGEMEINIDVKSNKCNFEYCRNHKDGECQDKKARKDCLEIALSVLCVNMGAEDEDRL